MWAKTMTMMAVGVALLMGAGASAAEKPGRPLNVKPPIAKQIVKHGDAGWRARAMKARAEFAPDNKPPIYGNARATDDRGDRKHGDEVGSGGLRKDRGEGGSNRR